MIAVVGSGFGLYGYLPALVEGLGETVVLPRDAEARARARPELARALEGVHWVDNLEAALALATGVVIATPPARQLEVAARCAGLANIRTIVLEKPIAPNPHSADELLLRLRDTGKRVRVGYTLLYTRWRPDLAWPNVQEGPVTLDWTFMAHHFAYGLANWKREHDSGGGVLRFFGVHVLALLAQLGYDAVRDSRLAGEKQGEPERWEASCTGAGLPACRVRVDARSADERFEITSARGTVLRLREPFESEPSTEGADRRVGVLERLLRTFGDDDWQHDELHARANRLWLGAEAA